MAEKIDFKRTLGSLYAPTARQGLHLVEVPAMRFLMADGKGDPNTAPAYAEAVAALYAVAYAIKFASKIELGRDYVVPPLEGLWWADDMSVFASRDKALWRWTMMIMVPDWIGEEMIAAVIEKVAAKTVSGALARLRVETLDEGCAVQVLHIGSYDDEGPVLGRLHNEYLPQNGLIPVGRHHEIYLSDPRRVTAEKLRTILRQPVKPAQ